MKPNLRRNVEGCGGVCIAGYGREGNVFMSYILDALKKLEHEKVKKDRAGGMVNLSGELFKSERPGPEGRTGWKIAAAVVVAILVTFTLTWKFLPSARIGKKTLSVQPPKATVAAIPSAVSEPKLTSVPAISASMPPSASVPVPAANSTPATAPVSRSSAPVVSTPTRPASPSGIQKENRSQHVRAASAPGEVDAAAILTQQEFRKRQKDRNVTSSVSLPVVAPPADINLSGIAYQDERRDRRAVVNGFLMQEGGVVSGAVITDIYQDRVRFTQGGGTFELTLSSSAVPMPGK